MAKRSAFATRGARILAGVLLAGVAGCVAPAPETEGGELYHHNWWNYYARGTYFLKRNRVEEAKADFERSLGVIPGAKFGNARDMWRARTYGLHFVEGYFPNRELGVCLLERGDSAQAIRYLEISLRQEPSGRAKHYLNLARQRQLSGRAVPGPQLSVDRASEAVYTRERSLLLSGTAAGEGLIRGLSVGGRAEFVELALPSLPFSRRVALKAGTNVVELVAEDLLGQRAARRVVRIADWQPPRFAVRRIVADGRGWLVEGVCRDEFGVSSVTLGDSVVVGRSDACSDAPVSLRIPQAGATLTVIDLAGNRLACPLNGETLAPAAPAPQARVPAAGGRMARADSVADGLGQPQPTALAQMEAWRNACRRAGRGVLASRISQSVPAAGADRLRPSLSLRGCQALTRVFAEDFFVDGTASDGGGLSGVTINGENLLSPKDLGVVRAYFARRIPLDLGTNLFEVAATDCSGNRTSQSLTVVRIRPEYLDDKFRLSVGVPPLTPADAGLLGTQVKRSMETELTSEPVRFRLLERSEGWDFVLREQGLSISDLADPAAALRIGKMLPAEMLLMGRVIGEAKGVTVYLKVVDTSQGEVVFASDVYSSKPEENLDDAVAGLILKVEQGFPLVSGEVLRCQGLRVTLNVGRQDGASDKCRFLVFNAAGADGLADGRLCKAEGLPVELQVERVQLNTSTARIVPSAADALVKEGYHVYTR
jgi:hypothetical protein